MKTKAAVHTRAKVKAMNHEYGRKQMSICFHFIPLQEK